MSAEYTNRLPTETWIPIINFLYDLQPLPSQKTLALTSVRRTCRLFNELAFPRFWRRIIIDFDSNWNQVWSALEEDERKRSTACQLVIKICGHLASTYVGIEDDSPQARRTAVQLTNLEELEVYGGKIWSGFLEQIFNLPSLKVCKLLWADIPPLPSPCFTFRLSTLVIEGCTQWNFHSNPSFMNMLTRIPNLRELTILTCHLSGYSTFKNDHLQSNPTQSLDTSPINFLRLKPFRSNDPIYLTEILTFINDCPELRELDMILCGSEYITDTRPLRVTLEKLEKFYGNAVVAARVCRGLPVSDLYLSIPDEEVELVLSEVQKALITGSVPISKITIPSSRWDPNVMRIISECCRDLKELHYSGFIAQGVFERGSGKMNSGNSIAPSDLVSLLSQLPQLEILTLILYDLFPRAEVQDKAWESTSLAMIGDGIQSLRSVQLCPGQIWRRNTHEHAWCLFNQSLNPFLV